MVLKSLYFELSAGVLLALSGFWLSQNGLANGGLMAVGCLLILLTLTLRAKDIKQAVKPPVPAANKPPGLAKKGG